MAVKALVISQKHLSDVNLSTSFDMQAASVYLVGDDLCLLVSCPLPFRSLLSSKTECVNSFFDHMNKEIGVGFFIEDDIKFILVLTWNSSPKIFLICSSTDAEVLYTSFTSHSQIYPPPLVYE